MHALILTALTLPTESALEPIPLWQLKMFPSHACAEWQWYWWGERLSAVQAWKREGGKIPLSWEEEAERQVRLWLALKEAHETSYTVRFRQSRLRELREELGEPDFWAGRMPLALPGHFIPVERRDGEWCEVERR